MVYLCFFFFQAEDGIRDGHVTGVQTCALPILNITSQCNHYQCNDENQKFHKSSFEKEAPPKRGGYHSASCRSRMVFSVTRVIHLPSLQNTASIFSGLASFSADTLSCRESG